MANSRSRTFETFNGKSRKKSMAHDCFQSSKLGAGKFYGQVLRQRVVSSSILSEAVYKPETSVCKHSHELAYFSLLLEGNYSHELADKTLIYNPMSVGWHRDGTWHRVKVFNQGIRFFTVEIQPVGLESLNRFAGAPQDFIDQKSPLVWLAYRLYHEFNNWQIGSELVAEGITLEMLAQIARKRIFGEKHPPVWLLRVIEKLNEEFTENFSTEELALEANVHPVHLATVFRQFYRETIGEYVQKLRINYASKLLFDKDISLAEIAYSTGYADQSHFTRIFKRMVGVTPGAFRNSLNKTRC